MDSFKNISVRGRTNPAKMVNKKTVGFSAGRGRKGNILRSLDLISHELKPICRARNVLIKPNLVALENRCANTDVEAIEAVIESIRKTAPKCSITVGETGATAFYRGLSTDHVFEMYGYTELPKKYPNVTLTHFDSDEEFDSSPIRSIVGDTHLRITRRATGFDYKISLSIPKTHNFAGATFGIKNMAGLVYRRDMAMIHGMKGAVEVDAPKTILDRLPPGTISTARKLLPNGVMNLLFPRIPGYRKSVKMIHHNIVAFAERLWPDLVVLDGYECMEGDGPCNGTSVPMNLALASTDPLKADSLAARLIGFSPDEIGYLYYLHQKGFGDWSTENILGDDWRKHARRFRRHGTYYMQKLWRE